MNKSANRIDALVKECAAARETFFGPELVTIVVLFEGRGPWRKHHPRLFRRRVDMDIGGEAIRLIERADTNKAERITCPA